MLINVTQKHIDEGVANKNKLQRPITEKCPIALAISEKYSSTCCVGFTTVKLNGKVYHLTGEVTEFIHKFDGDFSLTPFSFELNENISKYYRT